MIDTSTSEGRAEVEHVLIMVHGIRDFGEWQAALEEELPKSGIATVPIKYGYFDALRFLFPLSWFRTTAIRKVAQRVRDAQALYPNARYSYLAHSFGTYVVARMLLEDPSFQADRIIFCGSVLPPDFPIAQLRCNFNAPVLNEIGNKDMWPVLAASSTWGYGAAGSVGFGQAHVKDRFHDLDHPGFLTAKFAREYWVPFLSNGVIVPAAQARRAGLLRRLLTVVSLKYALLGALMVFAASWLWQRPDLRCPERWLGQNEYADCFRQASAIMVPIVVEGRRSWFGYGPDEFRANWASYSALECWESRSFLSRDQFATRNIEKTNAGYTPLSVRSFVSSDNTERVQVTWLAEKLALEDACP